MSRFDVVRAEIEVNLVNAVAGAFVINESAGAELGNGQETRAGDELIAPFSPAPARDIGRKRQAREVVAGQKSFGGKIAVRIEVAFVDAFRLGQQSNLALGLGAEAARLVALGLRSRMVADDFVMQFPLAHGSAVESPPAFARCIESALNLVQHFPRPVLVEPT